MEELNFTKMEAGGNDYIYIDLFRYNVDINRVLSNIKKLCDRNYGIGADGIIFLSPSSIADARMIMFNKDTSEGKMCGNGIRCVAKYLFDNKLVLKDNISIETYSGIKNIKLNLDDRKVKSVSVYMGFPSFNPKSIPVLTEKNIFINEKYIMYGNDYLISCVSVGNPHAVIKVNDINSIDINTVGKVFEFLYIFPERANINFVEVIDKNKIYLNTWERGSGYTKSCGTGACASVAVLTLLGYLSMNKNIFVYGSDSKLIVENNDDLGLILTGDANTIYEGKVLIKK